MTSISLSCHPNGCNEPVNVSDPNEINRFLFTLGNLYRATTAAGDSAAQHWADIAVNSKHPLAPLANIPGVFAALWTPEVAPVTAVTLATAGYGFVALPKNLIHFTTAAGVRGIAASGIINSSRFGLQGIFGPGVYMARVGLPWNGFIKAAATFPIFLKNPSRNGAYCSLFVVCPLGFGWCENHAMNKKICWSQVAHSAAVLFAWACWAIAYWQSNLWWIPISLVPYFISNRYGHLLDK